MIIVHAPLASIERLDDLDHKRCDIFIGACRDDFHTIMGSTTICFADDDSYTDFLDLGIPHFRLERYND